MFFFKIFAKALANRMKVVLSNIISDKRSAFLPKKLLTGNVLIAYEIGHHLHHKSQGKNGLAALKIHMSKACDRVEWCFLQGKLRRLGFNDNWVNLTMLCVTTVQYKIPTSVH